MQLMTVDMARASLHSGMPTRSTARKADTAVSSAWGQPGPMSRDAQTMSLRAMYFGSSPRSSMRAR